MKLFWVGHLRTGFQERQRAYSRQAFYKMLAVVAEKTIAAKAYLDRAGGIAKITNKIMSHTYRSYALVIDLPFIAYFWTRGGAGTKLTPWLDSQVKTSEELGGP